MRLVRLLLVLTVLGAILVVASLTVAHGHGFAAGGSPGVVESAAMRDLRSWAIPSAAARAINPVAPTPDVIAEGRDHWADHCATCHANDGAGSPLGRTFYPPAPDMRQHATQALSDGELFYVIEHGIPFTGMPSWGTGTDGGEHDSWALVRFIRHLPALTPDELDEMDRLNPRSAADAARDRGIDEFLNGNATPATAPDMGDTMKEQAR